MLSNTKLILLAALGAMLLSTATYFYGRLDGSMSCDARHAEAALSDFKKRTEDGEARATILESELSLSRDFSRDLERQVNDEVSSNATYSSCILPANGLFLVNSAIKASPPR